MYDVQVITPAMRSKMFFPPFLIRLWQFQLHESQGLCIFRLHGVPCIPTDIVIMV